MICTPFVRIVIVVCMTCPGVRNNLHAISTALSSVACMPRLQPRQLVQRTSDAQIKTRNHFIEMRTKYSTHEGVHAT